MSGYRQWNLFISLLDLDLICDLNFGALCSSSGDEYHIRGNSINTLDSINHILVFMLHTHCHTSSLTDGTRVSPMSGIQHLHSTHMAILAAYL